VLAVKASTKEEQSLTVTIQRFFDEIQILDSDGGVAVLRSDRSRRSCSHSARLEQTNVCFFHEWNFIDN
jgi:hypothetical protein